MTKAGAPAWKADAVEGGTEAGHVKDAILDALAAVCNVASFVSFGPDLRQRFSRIPGYRPNEQFGDVEDAVRQLLDAAHGAVNVRTFTPDQPRSREFLYGLTTVDAVVAELHRLAADGLFTIVNETIDIHDGGVSGVAFGDVVEFAPDDTPRAVEKQDAAALPRDVAFHMLRTVYGFTPDLPDGVGSRIEFSIHPLRRGYRGAHTVVWEIEEPGEAPGAPVIRWPNQFSRFIGDKAFGLLIADAFGLPVPETTVLSRRVAPFRFGGPTGSREPWIRTCPVEQVPGRFTTRRGWTDPFALMHAEDPTGNVIASVLAQAGVDAAWSGALLSQADGTPLIEGVQGSGEAFMQGTAPAGELPAPIRHDVLELWDRASERLGPVRFEWVHDGRHVWVVQLHRGTTQTMGTVIYPGEPARYRPFDVSLGLEALRALVDELRGADTGIELIGQVGVTSHLGDLLRRARIPARIRRA